MEIRDLTDAHAHLVEQFPVGGRPRERYLADVRELVREYLPTALRTGQRTTIGGFDGGKLIAIATWSVQSPTSWRSSIIAVREGHVGRGHGTAMKHAVIDRARQAGVTELLSAVHVDNLAAQRMNDRLGASCVLDPSDPRREWLLYLLQL